MLYSACYMSGHYYCPFITLTISSWRYKPNKSSMCNFLQNPEAFSLSVSNISLRILSSCKLSLRSSLHMIEVAPHTKHRVKLYFCVEFRHQTGRKMILHCSSAPFVRIQMILLLRCNKISICFLPINLNFATFSKKLLATLME